jgi:hypothetical protein
MRNAYKVWSENLKGRNILEDLGVDGIDNIKIYLIETGFWVWNLTKYGGSM